MAKLELIFDNDGCPGLFKGPVIYRKDGNTLVPVLYFRKPKNVPQEEFDKVVKFVISKARKK